MLLSWVFKSLDVATYLAWRTWRWCRFCFCTDICCLLYILTCLMTPLRGATWTELKNCYSHTSTKKTQHPIFFTLLAHAAKWNNHYYSIQTAFCPGADAHSAVSYLTINTQQSFCTTLFTLLMTVNRMNYFFFVSRHYRCRVLNSAWGLWVLFFPCLICFFFFSLIFLGACLICAVYFPCVCKVSLIFCGLDAG